MSKNYFIVGVNEDILKNAGIEFSKMNIDGESGVVVDYENIQLLRLKSPGVNDIDEKQTSTFGIWRVEWDPSKIVAKVEYSVEVDDWDGNRKDLFVDAVRKVLSPIVEKDIIISVPHSRSREPIYDGKFYIWIWSSPEGNNGYVCPGEMWGIRVRCTDPVFHPSGMGTPIMDGEYAVGELLEDNLYIHHDICHIGDDTTELVIFERILLEVEGLIGGNSLEEKNERLKKLFRTKYLLKCFPEESRERMRNMKRRIRDMKRGILEDQDEINKTISKIVSMREKKRILENTIKTSEDYGLEYDRFLKVGGIKDVLVIDGAIKVFTKHIYITPENHPHTYDVGEFEMKIFPWEEEADEGIQFFNLTRKGEGDNYNVHHPHVNNNGEPCLGNIRKMMNKLLGEGNYVGVAQLGIQFLNHANLKDDMGKGILKFWPKVGEK